MNANRTALTILVIALVSAAAIIYFPSEKTPALFPGLRYLIAGENTAAYTDSQLKFCADQPQPSGASARCFRSLGEAFAAQLPFREIVSALKSTGQDCHIAMHYIVNAEYKNGADLLDIWNECDTTCFGACYHGGLEGLLERENLHGADEDAVSAYLKNLCDSVKDKYPKLEYQCYHGIGHALMLLTEGDLPQSLSMCDSLIQNNQSRKCYEGVFMENLPTVSTAEHAPKFIKADDPLYPCNTIDARFAAECYAFQVSYFRFLAKGDLMKTAEYCRLVPKQHQEGCFEQIGMLIAGSNTDYAVWNQMCAGMPDDEARQSCMFGGTTFFVDRFPGNVERLLGVFQYCSAVDNQYKKVCYARGGQILRQFADETAVSSACANLPELDYQDECLGV